MEIILEWGVDDSQRSQISQILYDSLGSKFIPVFGDRSRGVPFIQHALINDRLLLATVGREVVGVVGLQFHKRGYLDSSIKKAWKFLGRGVFRMVYNGWILEQKTSAETLYLDTIAVTENSRGRGIGKMMIQKVIQFAREQGFSSIKLSVINTNNREKLLYERLGFRKVALQKIPFPWSRTFGFTSAYDMVFEL